MGVTRNLRKQEDGGDGKSGGEIQTWLHPPASFAFFSYLSTLFLPPSCRFDQYESFDSRISALSSRDLYRSGSDSYGYGDDHGDSMLLSQRGGSGFGGGIGLGGGGGFDGPSSSYGVAKMRQNMRESFASGQGGGSGGGGWAGASRRSPRRGGSAGGRGAGGGFGSRRPDPPPLGGGLRGAGSGGQSHRGRSPGGGRGKLPSLLSNRVYPESAGFQGSTPGPHNFPGRHIGGGPWGGRQRGRKRPLNKVSTSSQKQKSDTGQKLTHFWFPSIFFIFFYIWNNLQLPLNTMDCSLMEHSVWTV